MKITTERKEWQSIYNLHVTEYSTKMKHLIFSLINFIVSLNKIPATRFRKGVILHNIFSLTVLSKYLRKEKPLEDFQLDLCGQSFTIYHTFSFMDCIKSGM